jgi:hypothetical protein
LPLPMFKEEEKKTGNYYEKRVKVRNIKGGRA